MFMINWQMFAICDSSQCLQLYHEIPHQTELELLKADLSVPVHVAHAEPVLDLECHVVSKGFITILPAYLFNSKPIFDKFTGFSGFL